MSEAVKSKPETTVPTAKPGVAAPTARTQPKKKKKKARGRTIFIIILLLLVGSAAALLYFNIYSVRDMVYDGLRGVPLVGGFIPASQDSGDKYAGMSTSELKDEIAQLERRVDSLTKERATLSDEVGALKRENERLKEFEEQQAQFKQDMQDFNEMVYETDPMKFWDWYQQVEPDQAAAFAREAAGIAQNDKEIKDYLKKIENMDEKEAALTFDLMMDTNANMVRDIMLRLGGERSGEILNNMSNEKRAALLALMYPNGM